MSYTHLTRDERYQIYALLRAGLKAPAIALHLKRSPSTIYREINRNRGRNGYWPKAAIKKARRKLRQRGCGNVRRVCPAIWEQVQACLKLEWSPEQIVNKIRQWQGAPCISHETIYRKIYALVRAGTTLAHYLRFAHPKRRRTKRANHNQSRYGLALRPRIAQRPAIVELRSRIGDWEGDTIVGANQQQAIVTWVERRSGFLLMAKVERKTAPAVCCASINLLRRFCSDVHTLTTDNGGEFSQYQRLAEATGASYFFADPYASWQRGTVENTNGLIRQYFPKNKRFDSITQQDIAFVMDRLNHRPRKRLSFRSPYEVFMAESNFALRS